ETMPLLHLAVGGHPAVDQCFWHGDAQKSYLVRDKLVTEIVVQELAQKIPQVVDENGHLLVRQVVAAQQFAPLFSTGHRAAGARERGRELMEREGYLVSRRRAGSRRSEGALLLRLRHGRLPGSGRPHVFLLLHFDYCAVYRHARAAR